jgi:hypothetical protein
MPDKKRIFLYIAILIPVAMILVTAFEVYFHQVSLNPKYNFLYILSKSEYGAGCWLKAKSQFYPETSTDKKETPQPDTDACKTTQFYIYDFSKNTSTAITQDEAKQLKLSPAYQTVSPDGFDISYYCTSSEVLDWPLINVNNLDVCVKKNDYTKRLHLRHYTTGVNGYYNFYFISWILNNNASTPGK